MPRHDDVESSDRMPIGLHLIRRNTRYFYGPNGQPVYVVDIHGHDVRYKAIPVYVNSPILTQNIRAFADAVEVGTDAAMRFIRQVNLLTPESEQYDQHLMDLHRLQGLLVGHPVGPTAEDLYRSFVLTARVVGVESVEDAWDYLEICTHGGCCKYYEDTGVYETLVFGSDMVDALREDPMIRVVSVEHQYDDNLPMNEFP
jgi:hypothetical protein